MTLYTDRTKETTAPNPTTALVLSTASIFGDPGEVDLYVAGVRLEMTIPADPTDVAAGGGLPSWLMSGSGTPVNVVTPSQQGALYQDTTNGTLYEAIGVSSDQWIALGGDGLTPLAKGIQQRGTGLYMVAVGADGDWSFGADGHIYAKAGGTWSLKI